MTDDAQNPTPPLRALSTERLTVRPATAADADATFAYRRLDEVGQWVTAIATDVEKYRASFIEPDQLGTTLIIEHEGAVVGDLMLRVENSWAQAEVREAAVGKQAELGWVLDPAHTGQGYATEAVRALIGYCFEELDVHRIVALCFADNEGSWRLMERLGMRREGHAVRESFHRSGEWMDSLTYALLADEYAAAPQSDSSSASSARAASTPQ